MIPIRLINTSNCRKLAMKMNRRMEAQDAVNFPNCLKLFEGSNDDRKKLLRQFLLDHRNLEKMEHQFDLARTNEKEQKGVEELLTIEGMRKAGVSELLACTFCMFEMTCEHIIRAVAYHT